jgi:ligand-binding SRPBCC domain-containing protein
MHIFQSEQWLPLPIELVFAFFANPTNLPHLMPAWQQARIEKTSFVRPPPSPHPTGGFSPLAAGEGTRLTFNFRPFPLSPVRLRWEAEIDTFAWNHHFSDTQLRGPFAHWHHTHTVTSETRPVESGTPLAGTLLRDEVHYQLPLGKLGDLAHPLVVQQLRRTFAYRQRRTRELLCA